MNPPHQRYIKCSSTCDTMSFIDIFFGKIYFCNKDILNHWQVASQWFEEFLRRRFKSFAYLHLNIVRKYGSGMQVIQLLFGLKVQRGYINFSVTSTTQHPFTTEVKAKGTACEVLHKLTSVFFCFNSRMPNIR